MHSIAIVGFGGIGNWHANNIMEMDETGLAGVYDINPKRTELAASKGIAVYPDYEALLADASIDTVIVATPNNFHKSLSIQALQAGKNVICEKPVMMNAKELQEVLAVAKEAGKLFAPHQNRRWDRDFNIVKNVLDSGVIGKPFYIESRVQGAKGIPGDWRCVKEAGGGMLYDWGVHLIDQIMWYVDSPVTEVYTHMLSVKFEDVDDNFKLMLRFENGLSALIEVDTYTFINLPRWHVSCTEGTMVVDNWDCDGRIVKAKTVEFNWEEGIVYTAAGPTKTMAPRPKESIEELPLPEVSVDCKDYYRNFARAAQGVEELIVQPWQALRVMKVIDAAFESGQKGGCVKCHI